MSYILDALRKADAQRERDPARGIHAQPVHAPLPEQAAAPRPRIWLWLALAAGVAALAAAAWQLMAPAPRPVAQQASAPQASGPVAAAAPAAPPPAAPAVFPPAPPPLPAPAPAAPAPLPAAAREAAKPAAQPASQPAAPQRLLPARDMPADIPKLAITGGVYSDNPAQRMLIVNGQVVNEGAQLAPDVVLEEIRARTAVLRVRGYRYSVAY